MRLHPEKNKKTTEESIVEFLQKFSDFLIYKNQKYGDSLHSNKVDLAKLSTDTKILSRIEDKLNRILASGVQQENDYLDLLGYLVHFCIAKDFTNFEKNKD